MPHQRSVPKKFTKMFIALISSFCNAEPNWFQELLQQENGGVHLAARSLYNSFVSCINSSENNDGFAIEGVGECTKFVLNASTLFIFGLFFLGFILMARTQWRVILFRSSIETIGSSANMNHGNTSCDRCTAIINRIIFQLCSLSFVLATAIIVTLLIKKHTNIGVTDFASLADIKYTDLDLLTTWYDLPRDLPLHLWMHCN
jgi:hypothetical protein